MTMMQVCGKPCAFEAEGGEASPPPAVRSLAVRASA
jgi:hypothetical protein